MKQDLGTIGVPLTLEPMEAKSAADLPTGAWQYEPKWDGFRCLAFKAGRTIELMSKSGKSLARYFPEVVERLANLTTGSFALDGELAVPIGDTLDFDALQARIHPAPSRIAKLSRATPAVLIAFDCLADGSGPRLAQGLPDRRAALERLLAGLPAEAGVGLSPATLDRDEAQGWLDRAGGVIDGVVAKPLEGPYAAGERAMVKVKHLRSADCVIGGFRYAAAAGPDGRRQVGSLLLGLFNPEGKLDHVGFTSGFADVDRTVLTARLEALAGGPGFTGDAPGGPSRWSTERSAAWEAVHPDLVVEVRYDHVTGQRFRHGTGLLRFRPDKAPRQCTLDQLRQEARPMALAAMVRNG